MSEILRFVLVDRDDNEADYEYTSRDEAIAAAGKCDSAVLMRTYTYDDSELVWTPDGSDMWPPKAYTYNDEDEVRDGFWRDHPQFSPRGSGTQNEQPTDTRCAFVDWVDAMQKSGQISESLAQDATL